MSTRESYDVVVLGSGIAGLAAALAAHECGLSAVLIEKTGKIGGTTSDSYGLIWAGDNHLMRRSGETDPRDDILRYMTFLGGGELVEERMLALVDHSPAAIAFFEIADPGGLDLTTRLNGKIMQQANTSDLIFPIAETIAHFSRWYTLLPGDVVSTGTPAGVGYGRDPKVFLQPGDVVEVEVSGIGILANRFVAAGA